MSHENYTFFKDYLQVVATASFPVCKRGSTTAGTQMWQATCDAQVHHPTQYRSRGGKRVKQCTPRGALRTPESGRPAQGETGQQQKVRPELHSHSFLARTLWPSDTTHQVLANYQPNQRKFQSKRKCSIFSEYVAPIWELNSRRTRLWTSIVLFGDLQQFHINFKCCQINQPTKSQQ